jgi:hypothetical protein
MRPSHDFPEVNWYTNQLKIVRSVRIFFFYADKLLTLRVPSSASHVHVHEILFQAKQINQTDRTVARTLTSSQTGHNKSIHAHSRSRYLIVSLSTVFKDFLVVKTGTQIRRKPFILRGQSTNFECTVYSSFLSICSLI